VRADGEGRSRVGARTRRRPGPAGAVAILAIVAFAVIASRAINSPGLYADEATQIVPALSFLKGGLPAPVNGVGPTFSAGGGHALHVMTSPYSGSVKSIVALPLAQFFHLTPATIRYFTILLAVIGLIVTYLFVRRLFRDAAVAALTLVLLAVDPSFVFYSRNDFPPIAISMLTKAFAGWQLLRWWDTRDRRSLALAMFALGIGEWDKIYFVWVIVAAAIALAAVAGREIYARLTRGDVFVGLGSFVVGCLPLIVYNLRSGLGSVDAVRHVTAGSAQVQAFPYDEARPGQGLAARFFNRLDVLDHLLKGSSVSRSVGISFPHAFGVLPLLFALAAVVVAALLVKRRLSSHDSRVAAFLLVFGLCLLAAAAATRNAFHSYHVILIYPLPHVLLAFTIVLAARRLRAAAGSSVRRRQAFAGATGALVLLPVALAAIITGGMLHTFAATGGRGVWSDRIYQLERYVFSARAPAVAVDWGFGQSLTALSQARIPLTSEWLSLEQNTPPPARVLAKLLPQPRTLYLLHAERATVQREARTRFFSAARQLHTTPTLVRRFADGDGRPLYEIYRLRAS
jgi:hypothetical protein